MKRTLIALLALVSLQAKAQDNDFFTPVHGNALRLPAVPLLTVDPFFCVWSKYDHLYDGNTTHWSGANHPINGNIRVDGVTYRFMGASMKAVAPLATEAAWTGKYVTTKPTTTWYRTTFNDSNWKEGKAAFGGGDGGYTSTCGTDWSGANTDIWIRRTFTLDEVNQAASYYAQYKHDDVFELYLNGTKIASHGEEWHVNSPVTQLVKTSLLKQGENVLACHCHNTTGGAYADMGLYMTTLKEAEQKSIVVNANNSYYTIKCGGVDLKLVFTSPFVMSDLTLFSTPINYVSYQVVSNDGQQHDVQLMLEGSAELAVNNGSQRTNVTRTTSANLTYFYTGNATQDVLSSTGDLVNWGYLYMCSDKEEGHNIVCGMHDDMLAQFQEKGVVSSPISKRTSSPGVYYSVIYNDSIGTVGTEPRSHFTMIGYDDTYSISYYGTNRKGYWTNNGRMRITSRFEDMYLNYDSIMALCRGVDKQLYEDALASAGQKYAEICAAVYRQTNAAHKLITDTKGNLMFLSRENNSGGFINTLDVTYPSQPLYWIYSPELAKAMLTPIFEYSALGKWKKPFANHDMGHYPKIEGNHYGADGMPVEESGNMLTLMAIIARLDGDLDYVRKYWSFLGTWTDYLVEFGKDPEKQLCTDDFMGESSRNANLAVKSIMGVMSYSELARMLGENDIADEYYQKAIEMRDYWQENAKTGVGASLHYLLNFGSESSTWSTKYNMVWDKIWQWDILKEERTSEMTYYNGKMATYGLPLDNRSKLCKSDWHFWAAAMTESSAEMDKYVSPIWNYINRTTSRVPVSDNHYCDSGKQAMFQARSVVGGYWMKVFMDKILSGQIGTGINAIPVEDSQSRLDKVLSTEWYDLYGRKVQQPRAGQVYIHGGRKVMK